MSVVIVASVFVSATRKNETQHGASREFLDVVRSTTEPRSSPALVLAETSAAITRATGETSLAREIVADVERFPSIDLVPVTLGLARVAAQLAATRRLRGADAIYLAVADLAKATLVTWDREMLERGAGAVPTLDPSEWLRRRKATPPRDTKTPPANS